MRPFNRNPQYSLNPLTMADWKRFIDPEASKHLQTTLTDAKVFIAVDASKSTEWKNSGCIDPFESEREFAHAIHQALFPPTSWTSQRRRSQLYISKWGSTCQPPVAGAHSLRWTGHLGGTRPSLIFDEPESRSCILRSDFWCLFTDGEVSNDEVERVSNAAQRHGVLAVPVIIMITGSNPVLEARLSVGMALYADASDAMFLYKHIGSQSQQTRIYIMEAKGRFQPLYPENRTADTDGLPSFTSERVFFDRCKDLNIRVTQAEARLEEIPGIQIGTSVETTGRELLVTADIERLISSPTISQSDLDMILEPSTFRNLALAIRTRGLVQQMRSFLERQRPGTVYINLCDEGGAADLVAELASSIENTGEDNTRNSVAALVSPARSNDQDPQAAARRRLRDAHARNRLAYSTRVQDALNAEISRNRAIDEAQDHLNNIERSSYGLEILSRPPVTNSYAPRVSSGYVSPSKVINLDFDTPSYRMPCGICCEEAAIMSLAIKKLDQATIALNTSLDGRVYPLWTGSATANRNPLSSQVICYDCAKALLPRSIYREQLSAVIPLVEYTLSNKVMINKALYDGFTGNSEVGEAQIAQIGMAVVDRCMAQSWVKEDEVKKGALEYLLNSLVSHTTVPARFIPGLETTHFSEALQWTIEDCHRNGLKSYSAQYPLTGFLRIISLGLISNNIPWEQALILTEVKALYEIIKTFLDADEVDNSSTATWKEPWKSITSQSRPETFWTSIGKLVNFDTLLEIWDSSLSRDFISRTRTFVFLLLNFRNGHSTVADFVDHVRNVGVALVERTVDLEGSWSLIDTEPQPSPVESEIIEERVVLTAESSLPPQAVEEEQHSPRPAIIALPIASATPPINPVELSRTSPRLYASERSFIDSSPVEEERIAEAYGILQSPRADTRSSGSIVEESVREYAPQEEEWVSEPGELYERPRSYADTDLESHRSSQGDYEPASAEVIGPGPGLQAESGIESGDVHESNPLVTVAAAYPTPAHIRPRASTPREAVAPPFAPEGWSSGT